MIPYSYNMVDMGGIDLAEANGTVVPGVYERITEAMNLCGDVILYNWKFAGIGIVPSAYAILQQTSSILINGMIQVTELDEITVIAIEPPIGPVEPLEVTENGVYEAEPPASGFNPVTVAVPERQPAIESISITENGTYIAPTGVDGYSPVAVNVPQPTPTIQSLSVTENGTYTAPAGVDGYSPVAVNVPQPTPTIQSLSVTENGTYTAPAGVDGYSPVSVNVSQSSPVIQPLSITENGTYTAPSGVDGYSPIVVSVETVDAYSYIPTARPVINTGISVSGLSVRIKFRALSIGECAIFGAYWSPTGFFLMVYNGKLRFHSGGYVIDMETVVIGRMYDIECGYDYCVINGTEYSLTPNTGNTGTLYLFTPLTAQGNTLNMLFEECSIYTNGNLVQLFKPVNSNGLYETISETVFNNTGTGTIYEV